MKKLEKIFTVTMFVIVVVMLSGCDMKSMTEGNVTPDLADAGYKAEANVTKLKYEIEDAVFWESAERMATLLEKTIEDRKNITVDVRLLCSDGSIIILQDFYEINLDYINDVWRSIASNGLIYNLATSEDVVRVHEAGKTVEVTGVVLRWWQPMVHLFDNYDHRVVSVCDLDGDGSWDYVTEGKAFFTDSDIVALEGEDGEKLGIGVDGIRKTILVPVEETATVTELYKKARNK